MQKHPRQLRSKSLAPSRAARRNDPAAALGRHPRPESVPPLADKSAWLKSALHVPKPAILLRFLHSKDNWETVSGCKQPPPSAVCAAQSAAQIIGARFSGPNFAALIGSVPISVNAARPAGDNFPNRFVTGRSRLVNLL
jgi:hypothetical protein